MKRRRAAVVLLSAYVLLSLATILAQLKGRELVSSVTDVLLMPMLGGFVLAAARRLTRLVVLSVIGLFWSWLGDWADGLLLIKIAFFLLAQVAFALAFWPMRRRSFLVRPGLLVAYGAVIVALIVALASRAGSLGVPVVIYGAGLGVMVVLATGLNRAVGIGAFLFLLSDIVLGVYFFVDPEAIPASLALNSALYLPAQLLLAVGVVRYAAAHPARRPPLVGSVGR